MLSRNGWARAKSKPPFPIPNPQHPSLTIPRLVRQLFTLAREHKPSIIFIDEIDALCANREGSGSQPGSGSEHSSRMKTEILVQLDGLGSSSDNTGVVVLAATNLPWVLDPAFRRRFEPRIYIPLPDREARRRLFEVHAGKWGEMLDDKDLDELASLTEGFSGSDVANVVKHALGVPLQRAQVARWFRVVSFFSSFPLLFFFSFHLAFVLSFPSVFNLLFFFLSFSIVLT